MIFSNSFRFYAVVILFIIFVIHIYYYVYKVSEEQEYNLELLRKNARFLKLKDYIDANTHKLKIYIGDFKNKVNDMEISYESAENNYGHGTIFARNKEVSKISTHSGDPALDFIFHQRMVNDYSVIVDNVTNANVVYIPIMLGSSVSFGGYDDLFDNMTLWLLENEKLFEGKLFLFVFSHLEAIFQGGGRDESVKRLSKYIDRLYVFTIEDCYHWKINYTSVVVPYPSITKFTLNPYQIEYNYNLHSVRLVDIFFTGNNRKFNAYRQFIYDNIRIKLNTSFQDYRPKVLKKIHGDILSVIFDIGFNDHTSWIYNSTMMEKRRSVYESIEWKRNSKLCLEPPGDTPTRRSLWDSVMHGCIPVLFTNYKLPFEEQIDYSRFVIRIDVPEGKIRSETNYYALFRPYLENTKWQRNAREYMRRVRQFLQFSWPYGKEKELVNPTFKYDAYGMVLARMAEFLKKK